LEGKETLLRVLGLQNDYYAGTWIALVKIGQERRRAATEEERFHRTVGEAPPKTSTKVKGGSVEGESRGGGDQGERGNKT